MPVQQRTVHLQYRFGPGMQPGAELHNPMFALLAALREHGSIRHAATAIGFSYRHVWGAVREWEASLGQPLVHWVQGQPARLTPFAERLLWAETRARTRLTPHIEALRSELERVLSDALDGPQQELTLYASHDLALPMLREVASGRHRLHLALRFMGSVDALDALAQGRCVVAGFHVPPLAEAAPHFAQALKPLLQPGRHKLIACLRRMQGLMVRRADMSRLCSLQDVLAAGARLINRQPGSGTRLLMTHLLARHGIDPERLIGWHDAPEDSHLGVAAAVACGLADCAVGVEAAARQFGLAFHPLTEEDYFLVCLKESLDEPALIRLVGALQSPDWGRALDALPGYSAHQRVGEVLSLTRALPWWALRIPKPAVADSGKPDRV